MTGTLATLIVCSWITKDGTASFTDNPLRIPEAYAATAVCAPRKPLVEYERFTRDDTAFVPKNRELQQVAPEVAQPATPEVKTPTPEKRRKRHRSDRKSR